MCNVKITPSKIFSNLANSVVDIVPECDIKSKD